MDEDLHDLSFIDSDRGWSVGENIMLAHENGSWSTLLSFTKKQLRSLFIFDVTNGWVGDGEGMVYTFDGDTIIEYALLDTVAVTDIMGIAPSDVWASCGNSIFHFDGAGWARDTTFPGEEIRRLSSFDGTTIWGVGTSLFRYDGVSWEVSALPVLNGTAYDISLSSAETGIICGETQGKGFVASFDDTIWTLMSLQRDLPLYGLLGFANGNGWAVGAEGSILRRTTQ
jgi:hypothetical protein